jgi:hypothetical protein
MAELAGRQPLQKRGIVLVVFLVLLGYGKVRQRVSFKVVGVKMPDGILFFGTRQRVIVSGCGVEMAVPRVSVEISQFWKLRPSVRISNGKSPRVMQGKFLEQSQAARAFEGLEKEGKAWG